MPKYSQIVCQDNQILDKLSDIKGWHSSLIVSDDIIEYDSLYNKGKRKESYFQEIFVWQRGKGLVEYRCGYKAGVDYIWILKEGYKSIMVK